ncbi:endoplasmic reticulum lectin 1 [Lepeophtheirus salmonis]|uniref:endoplasmic reticulum lectin 1 n=1 Tax=Lepeophtheirus salmonis TaxID=72036 RepID=UPI003AF3E9C7
MRLLLICSLFIRDVFGGSYEIDDSIFNIAYLPKVDDHLLGDDPNVIKMVTKENEVFHCRLPKMKDDSEDASSESSEPQHASPYELMQSSFDKPCIYKSGVYWTYEYCHGAYIRNEKHVLTLFYSQFHASRIGETPGDKYYLGRTTKSEVKEQLAVYKTTKPSNLRFNNEDIPYLEINMYDGTSCDLNKLPRQSRIRFICYESQLKFISVQETSTCEYEVIIGFSSLCQHPYFKPKENFLPIQCHPAVHKDDPKPQALLALEDENKQWMNKNVKLDFIFGKQSGSVELVIKPVEDEFHPSQPLEKNPRPDLWKPSRREPIRPLTDPDIAERFLMGEYCLYGGSGWWRYEFCYGKSVTQYHEEKGGARVEIILGHFDNDKHLNWITTHPGKKPRKVGRKFVSHFYTDGDFCEDSGTKRHVEVKLKCKKTGSSSSVTIYLLEPATCEYVLGVESPLVCDLLHLADDETGLMTFNRDDFLHENDKFDEGEIITAESLNIQTESLDPSPDNLPSPRDSKDSYDNIFENIQDQLEQAGQNFMDKQKWIDEKDNFIQDTNDFIKEEQHDKLKVPSTPPTKAKAKTFKEQQEDYNSILINSARDAKNSYENILNNIQDQLEQAGQNFMEKQKWLGEKETLDYQDEEDEDEEFGTHSSKDEL